MFLMLQVSTVFLVSVAWAQALSHAMELPGKLRLNKTDYLAVQTIYYPGFTIGGAVGEGFGMVATLGLLLSTGRADPAFLWVLVAFGALLAMHATYWIVTHPVNKFWLKDVELKGAGASFFAIGTRRQRTGPVQNLDEAWISLRNRWELSHVIRAAFAGIALLALIVAIAL